MFVDGRESDPDGFCPRCGYPHFYPVGMPIDWAPGQILVCGQCVAVCFVGDDHDVVRMSHEQLRRLRPGVRRMITEARVEQLALIDRRNRGEAIP